jgi:hypothetical protein
MIPLKDCKFQVITLSNKKFTVLLNKSDNNVLFSASGEYTLQGIYKQFEKSVKQNKFLNFFIPKNKIFKRVEGLNYTPHMINTPN